MAALNIQKWRGTKKRNPSSSIASSIGQMCIRDSGYTATRLIRELPREDAATVPILAMTADAFAEDIQAAREAGMDSHIAKPLDIAELKQTISRFL